MGKTEKFDHMKLIGQYAGGHKNLITLGRVIAAISAVMALIPFYDLWKIIRIAVNGEFEHLSQGLDQLKIDLFHLIRKQLAAVFAAEYLLLFNVTQITSA